MDNVVLLGKGGMLAFAFQNLLKNHPNFHAFSSIDLDITNHQKLKSTLSKINPDIILNCAGFTNVDGCESYPFKAFSVNSNALVSLSLISNELNSKLIHFSTDYVFDGKKSTPYTPKDSANPVNTYGKSKFSGENFIENLCNNYLIIRTSWLFGPNGNNFVDKILSLSKNNKELKVVNDQIGCPTYTFDLAKETLNNLDQSKILHLSGSKKCSWFDFAKAVINLKNNNTTIKPISTKESINLFNLKAIRPSYSVLKSNKTLPGWGDSLNRYLKEDTN